MVPDVANRRAVLEANRADVTVANSTLSTDTIKRLFQPRCAWHDVVMVLQEKAYNSIVSLSQCSSVSSNLHFSIVRVHPISWNAFNLLAIHHRSKYVSRMPKAHSAFRRYPKRTLSRFDEHIAHNRQVFMR